MGWESFDVVRFDLEPLLQYQTRTAKPKSAYNLLIIKEIDILSHHYGHDFVDVTFKRLVDPDKLPYEWSLAKQTVLEQLYPRDKTNQLLKLLHMYHQDSFPNLMVLANLSMIMPYQIADCERGFSAQNHMKSSKRNRMQSKHLNTLMMIRIEGGKLEEFNFSNSVDLWRDLKK